MQVVTFQRFTLFYSFACMIRKYLSWLEPVENGNDFLQEMCLVSAEYFSNLEFIKEKY